MKKVTATNKEVDKSYENAYNLNEIARVLKKFGTEIEDSVSLFDSIGEKNEMFRELEKNITSPLESIIRMNNISQKEIYNFVLKNIFSKILKNKHKCNFIHIGKVKSNEVVFFISTIDNETKELLLKIEFEHAMSELWDYLNINFCFLDKDMESDLNNTEKIHIVDAN